MIKEEIENKKRVDHHIVWSQCTSFLDHWINHLNQIL